MPLEAPVLDRRRFEEIFEQARLRIPRYTPEWRDWNESDPGITLLQLFAWLTELQLYELNRVPDRSYIKFLQLLGLELRPAQPARADLTFTPRPNAPVQGVPERTRVAAAPPDGGPPLTFETEKGLSLARLPLTDVQVFDSGAFTAVTAANDAPGTTYRPLGWAPQVGNALYLGFSQTNPPTSEPFFPDEWRLRVFLPPAARSGLTQNATEAEQPPAPPVRLVWEYLPAPDAAAWRQLRTFEDETAALTRDGYLVLEGPASVAPLTLGDVEEERYWVRGRLEAGTYPGGAEPEIDTMRPNTVPAQNLATVHDEPVGVSEGHPDQIFRLRRTPVRADTLDLRVLVPGSDEAERWTMVDDLLGSGPEDTHYTLNANSGEIRTGNRRHGQIPPAGAELLAVEYRFGGGRAGNVSAGAIDAPLDALPGVEAVINERAAVGGSDEQDVEDLKARAPSVLRHRNRAVTPDDFTELALSAGGVAKATAIALAHPDHPGVEVPGAVTVVVVPDNDDYPPEPSPELIRHVCRYLNRHRLVTTELYVKRPAYQSISVHARVAMEPYAASDAVERAVVVAIDGALHPLARDFGEDLFPTSLYSVLLGVEGVSAVPSLTVFVGRAEHELSQPVVVPADGLLYGADHEITVEPRRDQ
jgi:predicted phage baseplate assembly protein